MEQLTLPGFEYLRTRQKPGKKTNILNKRKEEIIQFLKKYAGFGEIQITNKDIAKLFNINQGQVAITIAELKKEKRLYSRKISINYGSNWKVTRYLSFVPQEIKTKSVFHYKSKG